MIYIILGEGFEEAEAIVPCDLLRRAGADVRLAGIGAREIRGSHGVTVVADCIAEETALAEAEMLVLPGGLRGVASIRASSAVLSAVRAQYERGAWVAAICAAPTILAELGLLDGKRAICYPGMEEKLSGAQVCPRNAVRDGNLITGRAAGASFEFGLVLIDALYGTEKARQIAAAVVYDRPEEGSD